VLAFWKARVEFMSLWVGGDFVQEYVYQTVAGITELSLFSMFSRGSLKLKLFNLKCNLHGKQKKKKNNEKQIFVC
jgi:hypothetical protein